jgi:hypothetical protein
MLSDPINWTGGNGAPDTYLAHQQLVKHRTQEIQRLCPEILAVSHPISHLEASRGAREALIWEASL